jgi:hypothetical protein
MAYVEDRATMLGPALLEDKSLLKTTAKNILNQARYTSYFTLIGTLTYQTEFAYIWGLIGIIICAHCAIIDQWKSIGLIGAYNVLKGIRKFSCSRKFSTDAL